MKKLMKKLTETEELEQCNMNFKTFKEKYEEYFEEHVDGKYGLTFEELQGFIASQYLAIVPQLLEDTFGMRFQAIVFLEDGYVVIDAEEGSYEPLFTDELHFYKKTNKTIQEELTQQCQFFEVILQQYQQLKKIAKIRKVP